MISRLSSFFIRQERRQLCALGAKHTVRFMGTAQYEGTFKDRAAGKTQLKEFYKFTHPDFFSGAPEHVRTANEKGVQDLNAYLQSTQTLNQTVTKAELTFYVDKQKLLESNVKGEKTKPVVGSDQFKKLEITLEPLRADISYNLRQKHYTDAVRALVIALDQATIDLEEGDEAGTAQRFSMGEFRHQFTRHMDASQDLKRAPERMEKKLARMTKERYYEQMAATEGSLVTEQKRKVIMNIYRKRYGIPDDLMVRKADKDIRQVVQDSEALQKLGDMVESGIHPSLIFFEKGMAEDLIQKVTSKLHGTPQQRNSLLEVNAILTSGNPQLGIMFHGRKNGFLIKKVAGFISVPYNFSAQSLKEYVELHANEARIHARNFVQSQKAKSKVDQALWRSKQKI